MRIRSLPLGVLLIASCSEPPPPPPPPPTPAQRLERGIEKLRKLAEEQLAAAPDDARLQLWVAAFKGQSVDTLPPSPLAAVLRASKSPGDEAAVQAVEAALPASSHASLFRASWILLNARKNPEYWKAATEAVEEALKRNRWECPVRAFDAWALDWLETHEPDALVRACFKPPFANTSRAAIARVVKVTGGMALAGGSSRLDAPRVARAARRLIEERLLKSPEVVDVALGHAFLPFVLEYQFLIAWRAKDLETARSASLAVEEHGRRHAAWSSYSASLLERTRLEDTISALFKAGALKPPFPPGVKIEADPDTPENAAWRKEALKEVDAGAKAYGAARKALATRTPPVLADIEAKRPPRSPLINYLGQALRDRDFLFTDAYPKDRHEQLLNAAFQNLNEGAAVGEIAYGWVVLDNLPRPATIPSKDLARHFSSKDFPNAARDMDVYALLRTRGAEAPEDRRPPASKVRDEGTSMFGYLLLLRESLKAKPSDAVIWLPDPKEAEPSREEVAIAETLRAATEKDFGLDWSRWKSFLETGR